MKKYVGAIYGTNRWTLPDVDQVSVFDSCALFTTMNSKLIISISKFYVVHER